MAMSDGRKMTPEEEAEMGRSFHDYYIEDLVSGLRRFGCVPPQYRDLATRDADMAEAIRRFEAKS